MKKQILFTMIMCAAPALIAMEDISSDTEEYGLETDLLYAAERGDYQEVFQLLEEGAFPDSIGEFGQSALSVAAEAGNSDIVELLIKFGANVNIQEHEGVTPLMWAARNARVVSAKLLLAAGAKVNTKANNGFTPLIEAVRAKSSDIIRLLLDAGADIFAADINSSTALMWAAGQGNLPIIETLLTYIPVPEREYIQNIFHALAAMKKMDNPRLPKDMRNMIKDEIINLLVEKRMERVHQLLMQVDAYGLTAWGHANSHDRPLAAALLNLQNPASNQRIRQLIRNNINHILFGEPKERKQYGETTPVAPEKMKELFGYFGESPEEGNQ